MSSVLLLPDPPPAPAPPVEAPRPAVPAHRADRVREIAVSTRRYGRAEPPTHGTLILDPAMHFIGLLLPRRCEISGMVAVWRFGRSPAEAIRLQVVRRRHQRNGFFHWCRRLHYASR